MNKKNFLLFLIFLFFSFFLNANTFEKTNSIYLIRHALAPGNGDPDNFDLSDCSTQDTASFAFMDYEELSYLNSFYSQPFILNKDIQMKDLKKFIFNLKSTNNVVFVTHYVVIAELINYFPESGEIIEIDKNMNILNTFKIK